MAATFCWTSRHERSVIPCSAPGLLHDNTIVLSCRGRVNEDLCRNRTVVLPSGKSRHTQARIQQASGTFWNVLQHASISPASAAFVCHLSNRQSCRKSILKEMKRRQLYRLKTFEHKHDLMRTYIIHASIVWCSKQAHIRCTSFVDRLSTSGIWSVCAVGRQQCSRGTGDSGQLSAKEHGLDLVDVCFALAFGCESSRARTTGRVSSSLLKLDRLSSFLYTVYPSQWARTDRVCDSRQLVLLEP